MKAKRVTSPARRCRRACDRRSILSGRQASRQRGTGADAELAIDAGEVRLDHAVPLADGFSGEVLKPDHAGYDAARTIHNGLIDKRPAPIARCLSTADVVDAVNAARDASLEVSVRGGGHNIAGKAVTEGGLMIDLSRMKGIHVDPARRTVRAQGGVTVGELDRATAVFGLATPSGTVTSTGIGG